MDSGVAEGNEIFAQWSHHRDTMKDAVEVRPMQVWEETASLLFPLLQTLSVHEPPAGARLSMLSLWITKTWSRNVTPQSPEVLVSALLKPTAYWHADPSPGKPEGSAAGGHTCAAGSRCKERQCYNLLCISREKSQFWLPEQCYPNYKWGKEEEHLSTAANGKFPWFLFLF